MADASDILAEWLDSIGPNGSRNSMNTFQGNGSTTSWNFNFAGGYIAQADVKAYVYDINSGISTPWTPVFTGPNTVLYTPALVNTKALVVYRDTPKNLPLVDFAAGAPMTEKNLDTLAEQAVFVGAEMVDRFDSINTSSTDAIERSFTALTAANAAVTTANAASATAGTAVTTANSAVTTANTANTTANTANTKADTALAYTLTGAPTNGNNVFTGSNSFTQPLAVAAPISAGQATTKGALDAVDLAKLARANNLADLTDVAQARTNLIVYSKTEALAKANNLSDVASVATSRGNLGLGTQGAVSGFRNRIMNPTGRVHQRGTVSVTASQAFLVDRWRANPGGVPVGKAQFGQDLTAMSDGPNASANMYMFTAAVQSSLAVGDIAGFQQCVENTNIEDFRWGTAASKAATLSFVAKGSQAMTISAAVRIPGTPADRSFVVAVALTTSAQRFTISIPALTSAGTPHATIGALVEFYGAVGSTYLTPTPGAWATGTYLGVSGMSNLLATNGAFFRVSEVQLEVGSVATDFEIRPYGVEEQLCMRYYQKSYGTNVPGTNTGFIDGIEETTGTTDVYRTIRWTTRMRSASPSVVIYDAVGNVGKISTNGANNNVAPTGVVPDNLSPAGFKVFHSAAGVTRVSFHWTADAELS